MNLRYCCSSTFPPPSKTDRVTVFGNYSNYTALPVIMLYLETRGVYDRGYHSTKLAEKASLLEPKSVYYC